METVIETKVRLKDEYYLGEIAVPIGDYLWWGNDRLPCRWSNSKFQVYLYGQWLNTEREYYDIA